MIRHIWSILCSKAEVHATSSNISLLEIIETVQVTSKAAIQFPQSIPFEGALVTLWGRRELDTPVTAEMRLRILGPAGQALDVHSAKIDLRTTARARNIMNLVGLSAGGTGVHEFEVSWRMNPATAWQSVAAVPLDLHFAVQAAGA